MKDDPPLSPQWPLAAPHTLIFFDGVCGLCNRFVDFVLRQDTTGRCLFAPLQGETARRLLGPMPADQEASGPSSVVVLEGGQRFERAAAVAIVLARLGRPWATAGRLLHLMPTVLANRGYNLVAAHRYALFGRRSSCRLPAPSEAARFLP